LDPTTEEVPLLDHRLALGTLQEKCRNREENHVTTFLFVYGSILVLERLRWS
jgi:hypothetical protein